MIERETIQLTPQLAKEFLAHLYHRQRKCSEGVAESYARDIRQGRWKNELHCIDTPIMFTAKGEMMNGQHRCKAVIRANQPITIDVARNVPEELFDYIDGGRTRTLAQFINCTQNTVVASIATFANCIERGNSVEVSLHGTVTSYNENSVKTIVNASRSEILEYANSNMAVLQWAAQQGDRIYRCFNGGSKKGYGSALWLIVYLYGEAAMKTAENLVTDLSDPTPKSIMLAKAKEDTFKKLLDASRNNVTINASYWCSLVLALYSAYGSNKTRLTTKNIKDALTMHDDLLKMKRKGNQQ